MHSYHSIFPRYMPGINDMIVAVDAAKEGVTMGEGHVSGLMLACG